MATRIEGQTEVCSRCGQRDVISAIGAMLVHFVCDNCRMDNQAWHYGQDVTIDDMERQLIKSETGEML